MSVHDLACAACHQSGAHVMSWASWSACAHHGQHTQHKGMTCTGTRPAHCSCVCLRPPCPCRCASCTRYGRKRSTRLCTAASCAQAFCPYPTPCSMRLPAGCWHVSLSAMEAHTRARFLQSRARESCVTIVTQASKHQESKSGPVGKAGQGLKAQK